MNQGSLAISLIEKLTPYLHFTLLLLSVIIFFDILLVFKKPNSLKYLFLSIAVCTFISNYASLLQWSTGFKYIPRILVFFFSIQMLYHLYNHTYSKKLTILFFTILVIFILHISTAYLISPNTHNWLFWIRRIFRLASLIILLYISFYVYQNLQLNLKKESIIAKKIASWTKMTILLLFLSLVCNGIQIFGENYIPVAIMIVCIIQIIFCFGIIYRPPFINRSELTSKGLNTIFKKGINNAIDENIFVYEFYTKQYYKSPNASDQEFSNILGVNVQILNDYVSTTANLDFMGLINKNRIDYFIILTTNKEFKDLTIERLSELAGFGSRHSFYRSFKKYHGGSPSDLIRMHN